MKINIAAASIALLITGSAQAGGASWSYDGQRGVGPDQWGNINAACEGAQQSPIDIITKDTVEADLTKIKFRWGDSALQIKNNGHTIQANYDTGSTISVNGDDFDLLQLHFHAPSEHALNGKLYDMEAHFVHQAANGSLAVIGVFFEEGKENKALVPIWSNTPEHVETKDIASIIIDAGDLLPRNTKDYFHYQGSLTTPPCSEIVSWYVLEKPIEVSPEQIRHFSHLIQANNRPLQAINRRFVLKRD